MIQNYRVLQERLSSVSAEGFRRAFKKGVNSVNTVFSKHSYSRKDDL
ncbi:MAG: hypothetical protein ACJAVN_001799 [Roseivirga sp.]|jgi:hypothetical protein